MEKAKRSRTDRLILTLGGVVVALGLVCLWVVFDKDRFADPPPTPAERALTQLRAHMGGPVEVRYTEEGRSRAVCGYAGHRGQSQSVIFVSRPNRIMTSLDPLPGEFRDMLRTYCPGFAAHPSRGL